MRRAFGLIVTVVSLLGLVQAQSFTQRLMAPIFYEIGIQPGFQNNPLNLSEVEVEKTIEDGNYLDGIIYSSSNTITFYGKLNYAPRLIKGRKTRINLQAFHHYYSDIPERNYQSYSMSVKQSLGKYRYLDFGYWILPDYYLRNYLFTDPVTLIREREVTRFGTDRAWIGFQHRLTSKNRMEYRFSARQETYSSPFSHFDLNMQEMMVKLRSDQFSQVAFSLEFQYGLAFNDNQIDEVDRSYRYLNFRPAMTYKLPGKNRLRLTGRYDQRAYESENLDDPLHAGRYQEEFRLELSLLPKLDGPMLIEPFIGYRERRVHSSDAAIRDLKSYSRNWFGIRLAFESVIDMYF